MFAPDAEKEALMAELKAYASGRALNTSPQQTSTLLASCVVLAGIAVAGIYWFRKK